jgi:hypothetical protein
MRRGGAASRMRLESSADSFASWSSSTSASTKYSASSTVGSNACAVRQRVAGHGRLCAAIVKLHPTEEGESTCAAARATRYAYAAQRMLCAQNLSLRVARGLLGVHLYASIGCLRALVQCGRRGAHETLELHEVFRRLRIGQERRAERVAPQLQRKDATGAGVCARVRTYARARGDRRGQTIDSDEAGRTPSSCWSATTMSATNFDSCLIALRLKCVSTAVTMKSPAIAM